MNAITKGARRLSAFLVLILVVLVMGWSAVALAQECQSDMGPRASVTLIYGGQNGGQRVVYTPSDSGALRAMDPANGRVLWTFTTEEAAVSGARGALMTDVRVLRFDANHDGTIDISSGDKVWLYFGTRRSGPFYYALDVTDRNVPRVLWKIGADVLKGAGEAWSTPTIARVKVAGATQNGEHFVLIIGGGYAEAASPNGRRLFMVDAATGHLLWSAGGPTTAQNPGTPDLLLQHMTFPAPARVAALDTDGDGFADRLYAADLGGQIWRFDVWNGHARSSLVTGGVIASLGIAAQQAATGAPPGASPADENDRRFFNAPDVALIQRRNAESYYNVAIGSGDALAPGSSRTHDRFYSIRDRSPFTQRAQSAYDAAPPILDADLVDLTGFPPDVVIAPNAQGWKLDLRSSGAWLGEKVLAESLTANGAILFATYQPSFAEGSPACAVGGTARVYVLNLDTGNAVLDLNDDQQIDAADTSMPLSQPGIPGEISLQIGAITNDGGTPAPAEDPSGAPGSQPAQESRTRCQVGAEILSQCVPVDTALRTFWQTPAIN